jgi:xyloglucan 6-xylosyltransferase
LEDEVAAEDFEKVNAASGKDVKDVKEEISKPIEKPTEKSVKKPVEKVSETKKTVPKVEKVKVKENAQQVEAELGAEETADELADFEKFANGEKEEKVSKPKSNVDKDSVLKREEKLIAADDSADKKKAADKEPVQKKEETIEVATSKKDTPVKEKKSEFVESNYEKKPIQEKKPEEKSTDEKKSGFVEPSYERKSTEEKVGDSVAVEQKVTDEPPAEQFPGIKISDNVYFELPADQLKRFTQQAVDNMTRILGRDKPDAFTLGPKITDWDEQRAAWLDKNPHMKSTDPHKPKVLLLTGSQPWPCKSPVGDHYLLKMIKNKVDYTRIHNIEIFYSFAHLDKQMSHFWAKLPLMRKMMLMRPEMEWIFWMDSDAMFTDMVFEIPFEKYKDDNFVMWGWSEGLWEKRSWVACNTGVMFLRNNQWTLDLLEKWSHFGPEGQIRDEAGVVLSTYLTSRGPLMADDQSALVFLMLTDPTLRPKMFIEDEYQLSGYWEGIVDQLEDVAKTSKPGAGGKVWPFTTHFTGCQPCSGQSNPLYGDRCLTGMERAFNFADDQILRPFGFAHETLQVSKVLRIRNETAKPVWSVPVDNPWSVQSFYE